MGWPACADARRDGRERRRVPRPRPRLLALGGADDGITQRGPAGRAQWPAVANGAVAEDGEGEVAFRVGPGERAGLAPVAEGGGRGQVAGPVAALLSLHLP